MTIVRVGMAPRLPHLTPTEFQEHWRTAHADAVKNMVGLRSYVQNHAILAGGHPILPYPGFDACAELEFDSIEAHDAAFASEQYQAEVREDEDRFVDKSKFSMVLAARRTMFDRGMAEDGLKLMTFWRRHPECSVEGLMAGSDRWAAVVQTDGSVLRHDQLRVQHSAHEGRRRPACDHVDVLWLDGLESASTFMARTAQLAALAMAGQSFGTVHHLATVRAVIGTETT